MPMYDVPIKVATAITPHDSNASITGKPIAIYVGGAGNAVMTLNGSDVTVMGLLAGHIYRFQPTAIKATNTTASNMLAIY